MRISKQNRERKGKVRRKGVFELTQAGAIQLGQYRNKEGEVL